MSATVDAEKISNYMNGCPILKIPGRTFPVTSFFLEDVIELTDYRLDARSDSPYVARRGKRKPVMLKTVASTQDEIPTLDDDEEATTTENALAHTYAASTRATLEVLDEHLINMDLIVLLLLQICWQNPTLVQRFSSAILIFLPVSCGLRIHTLYLFLSTRN
jgi:ATP-dependent RNA helicase DHX29